MLSKALKRISMVLAVTLTVSTFNTAKTLASDQVKYSVAIKGERLYSLEIRGDEVKSTLVDENHPINKGYGGDGVSVLTIDSKTKTNLIFDRYGKISGKIEDNDFYVNLFNPQDGVGSPFINRMPLVRDYYFGKIKFGLFYLTNRESMEVEEKQLYADRAGLIPYKYDEGDYQYCTLDYLVVKKDGKLGILDEYGTEILPCQYNEVKFLDRHLLETRLNGKKQVFFIKNKELIKYDAADTYTRYPENIRYIVVRKNGKLGILRDTGEVILPIEYDEINNSAYDNGASRLYNELNRVKKDGKWGFVDKNGKFIVPLKYDDAGIFSNGLAKVGKNRNWDYIDKTGKVKFHFNYEKMGSYGDGLFPAERKGRWGYVDKKGKKVIDFKHDYAASFQNGFASVMNNWKMGLINKKGKMIYPCESEIYINFEENNKNVANIMQGGKYGLINKNGKEILACKYDYRIDFFDKDYAVVVQNGRNGIVNGKGKVIYPCKSEIGIEFNNGFASIKEDGKYGIINKKGKIIYPCKSEEKIYYTNGIACIKQNDKYGLIDNKGKIIYPCKSSEYILNEGPFIQYNEDGKFILKNRSGKLLYSGKNRADCSKYMAVIRRDNDKDLIIDVDGNRITNKDYDSAVLTGDDKVIIGVNKPGFDRRNYLYGLIDRNGNEVIAPIYDNIDDIFKTDAFIVEKDGKTGIINSKGKQLLPIEYDKISYAWY